MKKRRLSSPKRNNQQASNSSTNFPMEVDQSSNLTVALRVRPLSLKEAQDVRSRSIIDVPDNHIICFDPPTDSRQRHSLMQNRGPRTQRAKDLKYAFDIVFNEHSTQLEVYNKTTRPLISSVLSGCNCTVFAYGATGSGKTHTMIGTNESPGVMVLTVRDLFQELESHRDTTNYEIRCSYLEVYNEKIRDLFVQGGPSLELREFNHEAKVSGLSERQPQSVEEVFEWLESGNRNRSMAPTDANEQSSRSHAVFQITIKQRSKSPDITGMTLLGKEFIGKLSLIDLAGSERAAATSNRGERMQEGAKINQSLLALANCINVLGQQRGGNQHVPFRNSKLTRLLKDSLGGNCKTVMIATISPSSLSYEDTQKTLQYANKAKDIKTKVVKQESDVKLHVREYVNVIKQLQERVADLEKQNALLKSNGSNNNNNSSTRFDFQTEELRQKLTRVESEKTQMTKFAEELFKRCESSSLITPDLVVSYKLLFDGKSPVRRNSSGSPKKVWRMKEQPTTQNSTTTTTTTTTTQQSELNVTMEQQQQQQTKPIIQQTSEVSTPPSKKLTMISALLPQSSPTISIPIQIQQQAQRENNNNTTNSFQLPSSMNNNYANAASSMNFAPSSLPAPSAPPMVESTPMGKPRTSSIQFQQQHPNSLVHYYSNNHHYNQNQNQYQNSTMEFHPPYATPALQPAKSILKKEQRKSYFAPTFSQEQKRAVSVKWSPSTNNQNSQNQSNMVVPPTPTVNMNNFGFSNNSFLNTPQSTNVVPWSASKQNRHFSVQLGRSPATVRLGKPSLVPVQDRHR